MSFEIKELTVKSTDNIHTLNGRIYIPSGDIKGVVHIVHGMTEYIERYNHLMSFLAENGFVACGYDNLGHGKTVRDDSELGFISDKEGWKYLINDVGTFSNAVKNFYPDKNLYLFGHSMGSFIARLAAVRFDSLYKKLIICGTGGENPLSNAGLLLTDLMMLFKGKHYISNLVIKMAFGEYNKKFGNDSKYNWLTNDKTVIEKYSKDKLCTFSFTVSAMHDLIMLNKVCNKKVWYKEISKELPILLLSGEDDPVGNYGKGVKQVYRDLKNIGANVELKLYENCRHEILNDLCKQEAMEDILNFITD